MIKYNSHKDYFNILGVRFDASQDDILNAYEATLGNFYRKRASILSKKEKKAVEEAIKDIQEAFDVLSNPKARERYTKSRTAFRVIDSDDSPEVKPIVNKAKKSWKKLTTKVACGVLLLALVGGSFFAGVQWNRKTSKKTEQGDGSLAQTEEDTNYDNSLDSALSGVNAVSDESIIGADSVSGNAISGNTVTGSSISESETTTEDESSSIEQEESKKEASTEFVRAADAFGDVENYDVVHKKAQTLLDQINKAGLVNLSTGLPYSVKEIENILLYMNGAYVPENEQDAFDMYTEFLNFVCIPLNAEPFIYQVNYMGGESSFKDIIDENAKNPMYIDFTSAATFGTGYGYEYAEWLQNQYYKLLYTTDRKEYNKIYSDVWQSFADIMKGNGYTIYVDKSQYVITEQSLLTKSNVGIANLISFWLLNFEPFRNTKTQEDFEVIQKFISADKKEQKDTVSIEEMFAYINAVCDDNVLDSIDYAVDDEGNLLVDGAPGETWGVRTQSNTKAIALEQLASKGHALHK